MPQVSVALPVLRHWPARRDAAAALPVWRSASRCQGLAPTVSALTRTRALCEITNEHAQGTGARTFTHASTEIATLSPVHRW